MTTSETPETAAAAPPSGTAERRAAPPVRSSEALRDSLTLPAPGRSATGSTPAGGDLSPVIPSAGPQQPGAAVAGAESVPPNAAPGASPGVAGPSGSPTATPGQPAPALSGAEWRKAARAAQSALAKAKRNRRGRRPGKPITGVVKMPPGGGNE